MSKNSIMPKAEILSAIKKSTNVMIVTHARPDGDCLGAAFAMREYCMHLGKLADIVNDSPLPDAYDFIPKADEAYNKLHAQKYDLVIVVDCATNTRFHSFEDYLNRAKEVIWIDHHQGDVGFGTINWVCPSASSTCEMIYRLLKDEYLSTEIANYIFIGLSTDTGHFRHNNATAEIFDIAADLIRRGAKNSELCNLLYKNRTREKTKLIAKAIEAMRFYEDGKIALIPLTAELLRSCNITSNNTEGIIDYASSVKGARVAVCICEEKPNVYKVSFRSVCESVVDIAEYFGGGGHRFAAGCQICGQLEDVIDKIIRAAVTVLWTE